MWPKRDKPTRWVDEFYQWLPEHMRDQLPVGSHPDVPPVMGVVVFVLLFVIMPLIIAQRPVEQVYVPAGAPTLEVITVTPVDPCAYLPLSGLTNRLVVGLDVAVWARGGAPLVLEPCTPFSRTGLVDGELCQIMLTPEGGKERKPWVRCERLPL
jgi:hypothetical protein